MESLTLPVYQPQQTALQTILGALKLVSFVGSALLAALLIASSLHINFSTLKPTITTPSGSNIIASIPMKYTSFPDIGNVATPHLDTQINNIPITFLIDSGAKISALPIKYIDELKVDTTSSKRIYLRSATNNTTYGYLSEVTLNINQKQILIPIVFAEINEPLLGTFGFFDRYTILFENGQNIIIKEKT